MNDRRPTLPSLTGLRFLAALYVVVYHALSFAWSGSHAPIALLASRGFVGVSHFFVLSGFILAYTYLTPREGLRRTSRDFWWARIARVYPVYLLALVISVPQILKRPPGTSGVDQVLTALSAPLLLQAWWPRTACRWNCPGWSLSVEALFYAFFPYLGVAMARRSPRASLVVGGLAWSTALIAPLAYLLLAPDGGNAFAAGPDSLGFWLAAVKYNPLLHLGEFALGVAGGLYWLDQPRGFPRYLPGLVFISIAILLTLVPALPYVLLHNGLFAPLFLLLILSMAQGRGHCALLLASRPLVFLGEISYAMYLIHVPLLRYMTYGLAYLGLKDLSAFVWFPAYLTLTLILSACSFLAIEEPLRRWIRMRTTPTPTVEGNRTGELAIDTLRA